MHSFHWLTPIKDTHDQIELITKAKAENHGLFLPTHIIEQGYGGDMVGYFSIGSPGFPVTFAWIGECLQARESFSLINSVENLIALNGARGICMPVPKESPFHPLMESMGYLKGGNYDFFVKKL